jgi:hypothetical protein
VTAMADEWRVFLNSPLGAAVGFAAGSLVVYTIVIGFPIATEQKGALSCPVGWTAKLQTIILRAWKLMRHSASVSGMDDN